MTVHKTRTSPQSNIRRVGRVTLFIALYNRGQVWTVYGDDTNKHMKMECHMAPMQRNMGQDSNTHV
jgi:hypothetical protein